LTPAGGGLFDPGTAALFVSLPQQGTGAIQYVPSGLFEGNLMYVNWDFGEVRVLEIDSETGLPVDADSGEPTLGTSNPVDERFAYEIGVGPWGLEFDARSGDFFVSTWNGDPLNSIIQFSGPGFTNGTGGSGGDGGSGGVGGDGAPSDGGGCGCRVQEPRDVAGTGLLVGIVALFLLRRRRRTL
jgi:MYXO-CTERM domain-containing protein